MDEWIRQENPAEANLRGIREALLVCREVAAKKAVDVVGRRVSIADPSDVSGDAGPLPVPRAKKTVSTQLRQAGSNILAQAARRRSFGQAAKDSLSLELRKKVYLVIHDLSWMTHL